MDEHMRYGGPVLMPTYGGAQAMQSGPIGKAPVPTSLRNSGDVTSMERAIVSLRDEIEVLTQALNEMEKRLAPIMVSKDTEVAGAGVGLVMPAGASSLATCIAEESRKVQTLKLHVLRMMNLIDL